MTITKQDLIDLGCDPDYLDDWIAYRKQKKKPITQSVIKRMTTEAGKAGITLADAVEICAGEPWVGFKASYIANQNKNVQQQNKAIVSESLRDIHNTNW